MMQSNEVLFLSREDVIASGGADMAAAVTDVEHGFRLFQAGEVVQPHKTSLKVPPGEATVGHVNVLPSAMQDGDTLAFGCKLLGSMPSNIEHGLPRATGLIALFHPDTKMPQAIMDAQVISAMRTGAVSSVAARLLCRSEVSSVGLIGAGVNMRTQLLGVQHALPNLTRATVYSRNSTKHMFSTEMSERTGLDIVPTDSVDDLTAEHEFIITCVPKPPAPMIREELLAQEGLTIFCIGGRVTPTRALASMDRLVTDSWEDCKHRGTQTLPRAVAEGVVTREQIEQLGQLIVGTMGRSDPAENIFFCPVGLAFEDILVARRVYETAVGQGIGTPLQLQQQNPWI